MLPRVVENLIMKYVFAIILDVDISKLPVVEGPILLLDRRFVIDLTQDP